MLMVNALKNCHVIVGEWVMSESIATEDSGALMGMTVWDGGALGMEMRGHDVAMLQRLLAKGCSICVGQVTVHFEFYAPEKSAV